MDELTIDQSIDIYKKHAYGTAVRGAVLAYSKEKTNAPLSNDSYADALFLTDVMLQETMTNLSVLTGDCVDRFLDVLRKPFEAAVRRIQNVGDGAVRFILLDSTRVPALLKELKDNKFPVEWKFGRTADGATVTHFIVSDDRMLRDEKEHERGLTGKSLASAIQADVYFNSPMYAKLRQEYFNSIWDRLPDVDQEG